MAAPPISSEVPRPRRVAQTARISTGGLAPRIMTPKALVQPPYTLRPRFWRDRPLRPLPARKHEPSKPTREADHSASVAGHPQALPSTSPPINPFKTIPPRPLAASSYNQSEMPATNPEVFVGRAPPVPPSEMIHKTTHPAMTREQRAEFNRNLSLRLAQEEYLQCQASKKPPYRLLFSKMITKNRTWQPGQPRGKVNFFIPKTQRALEHEALLARLSFKLDQPK
ncbi:hypothetical protein V5O48_018926 [Marasmius crinis-equi]|uniref:Uncharacterized protein n=1 Tax=Marasmius crinis-equi TaxID=585013 RepID=A0ABR3EJY4_9AGAR